ncbi:MAG: MBL fold metallo-hydrolase [Thermofilum sp.]
MAASVSKLRLCDFEVKPLAEESLGVRSMSIFVATPHAAILLDPGVSLAPRRFGLPPHPEEFRALLNARRRVLESAEEADTVVVTHYHRDHFTPSYESLFECCDPSEFETVYKSKKVFVKRVDSKTPFNQKKRAWRLFRDLEKISTPATQIGEEEVRLGGLTLRFFPCVHGDARLGSVLVVQIRSSSDCSLIYAPDVQGPVDDEAANRILAERFELAFVGGPPLYLNTISSRKGIEEKVAKGLDNLVRIIRRNPGRVVVAHHMLRSAEWMETLESFGIEERDVRTYSSLLGMTPTLLEANRKVLYESDPPPPDYRQLLQENKGRSCSKLLEEIG